MTTRRGFCRSLAGLACVGIGGCKIEPILDLDHYEPEVPEHFTDLRPQVPDRLEDDEDALRALTEQFLDRELDLLRSGAMQSRPSEDPRTVEHLVELMRRFDVVPAGNRGNWRQPVLLDVVEPTGGTAKVVLRPESEAPTVTLPSKPAPANSPATPETPPTDDGPPNPDTPTTPSEPSVPESPPSEPASEPAPPEEPPNRAIELAALGAFRQRGSAQVLQGLRVTSLRSYRTPLSVEDLDGRVALLSAPNDLDLEAPDAAARVDALMAAVRETGALGCLLLTKDPGPAIERFREQWRRQVRLPAGSDQPMIIEGLLAAEAKELLRASESSWVLDVDLATRSFEVESHNVLAHVIGREHPGQAVVLTCAWDTPDPDTAELDTTRLLTTLAAFFQLAEWSRRSTPPKYSIVLLLTVDAGLAAGTSVHAAWSANFGVETKALLALDRPTGDAPAVLLSGRYDASITEFARRAVASDGRELLLAERLGLTSLAPYLRYPAPVMTIGAPDPDALGQITAEQTPAEPSDEAPPAPDPLAQLFTDVQILRNLTLALATRR